MDLNLSLLDNQNMLLILGALVAIYGAKTRMELPSFVRDLFKNNIFRVVFLSTMLVYKIDSTPHVALTVALLFVVSMHYLNQMEMKENFQYIEAMRSLKHL